MGSWIDLEAADGHRFKAWRATADTAPLGGVVLLQEIFGVNDHIRELVDGFAADGYDTIAPALFDRIEPGIELGYTPGDVERGRDLRAQVALEDVMKDVEAARAAIAKSGEVAAIGYCWGGTLAWLCATRLDVACAVGYYGSATADFVDETPNCPVTLMLGEEDATFPPEKIEIIREAHPEVVIFTYPGAGHGFACDHRDVYDEAATRQAYERTLDVFQRYLG